MSASLVGSEMCIRDRGECFDAGPALLAHGRFCRKSDACPARACLLQEGCLLYTSDAADDM
eukprot:9869489-Alexandrium_andersonii.AAC.1